MFFKIIENFASSSAPSNPLEGQLWYDTSDDRLKIYNGTSFTTSGSPSVSATQPTSPVAGDLWIDNSEKRLSMYDGTVWTVVGPQYNAVQGKTGLEAVTMVDTSTQTRTVVALYVGGVLAGFYSRFAFTPANAYAIAPYAVGREIKIGFNPVDTAGFKYHGTATSAENLTDDAGNTFSSIDFVRTNERDSSNAVVDQQMEGGLFVKGSTGLTVGFGDSKYAAFKTIDSGTTTTIELSQLNYDFSIRVPQGNDYIEALTLDTSTQRFGLYQDTPTATLDVTGDGKFSGDLTVGGNITVEGSTTYLNTETMRVQDPNIEYLSVGGMHIKKLGIQSIFDLKEITYLGFTSVILNIFKIRNRINKTVDEIIKFKHA